MVSIWFCLIFIFTFLIMSVDCTSHVIWGGVISDSSDEEPTYDYVRLDIDDVRAKNDDVLLDVQKIIPDCQHVQPSKDKLITECYTDVSHVNCLNDVCAIYPENQPTDTWMDPGYQECNDLAYTQEDAKGSNIFVQLDTVFTADGLCSQLEYSHDLSTAKEETVLPDNQILKMEHFCQNKSSVSKAPQNEINAVITLDSAQQLISAINSTNITRSENKVKSKLKKTKSTPGILSTETLAEERRLSLEKKIIHERTCQKCNVHFNTPAAKVSHDVTFHLVPTFENDRMQISGQAHVNQSLTEPEQKVACSVCTFTESKKNRFNVSCHKTVLHSGRNQKAINPIHCYFCRSFLKSEKLSSDDENVFWLTVHLPKKDMLMCYLCGAVIPKKCAMKRHLLVHKDCEISHVCKLCGKNFTFDEIKHHIISQRCIEDIFTTDEKHTKCIISCGILSSASLSVKSMLDFLGNPVAEIVDIPDNSDIQKVLQRCKSSDENSEEVSTSLQKKSHQCGELPSCFKVSCLG